MQTSTSERLFTEAQQRFSGGVNSPVRAFRAVGGTPRFLVRGEGARVWDVDGNAYLDYICSWGALLLGHAHPAVVTAVQHAAADGLAFGANTERELALARKIQEALPSVECLRFVNSGTEATMSAVRLARAYTGRTKIIKFAGGYHGHADALLARAGSGVAGLGLPDSAGVPPATVSDTLIAPYNETDVVTALFAEYGDHIAAVLVEPVAGNMGVVEPEPGFLITLRQLTADARALLIFDEVMTGFRLSWGGAQERIGIRPDLTCLGKIIGGGLPIGAYGGQREVMEYVSPLGPMYQAGTLAGNPVVMAAGTATLESVSPERDYRRLETRAAALAHGLEDAANRAGVALRVNRVGSMLTPYFVDAPVRDQASAARSNAEHFRTFFHAMLKRGILLPPSNTEAWFVSLAHTEADIHTTLDAATDALRACNC